MEMEEDPAVNVHPGWGDGWRGLVALEHFGGRGHGAQLGQGLLTFSLNLILIIFYLSMPALSFCLWAIFPGLMLYSLLMTIMVGQHTPYLTCLSNSVLLLNLA
jgi:hypothetical protein